MYTREQLESWADEVEFERIGPIRRAVKAAVIHPLANYLPAGMLRGLLRFGKSELAASNRADPGGWRSMVISYEGRPRQIADKVLVGAGSMAMALRNRRRLGGRILAGLIDACDHEPAHVLCVGAGPGHIVTDALAAAASDAHATLVDITDDPFAYGARIAREKGVADKVRFLKGDVRERRVVEQMLHHPPDLVKMLGICEYLTDKQIVSIARSIAEVMPANREIVFNSISPAHGTDRFFRRVFGLNMTYRTPERLQSLLGQVGFGQFVSIPEPIGVYHVVVGSRQP